MLTVPQGIGKGMAAALILNGTKVCTSFYNGGAMTLIIL